MLVCLELLTIQMRSYRVTKNLHQDKMTTQLEIHQDAVDFVKEVFKSMGGRVIHPRRPGHKDKYDILTPARDAFIIPALPILSCNSSETYPELRLARLNLQHPTFFAKLFEIICETLSF